MSKSSSSVRMGPISLVSLVIVLCLAVMSVLSVSTARATLRTTERQSTATSEIYLCETAGQEFLATVDGVLAEVRAGEDVSHASAMSALRRAGEGLVGGLSSSKITPSVQIAAGDDSTVDINAVFSTETGRRLNVYLKINDDATYRILQWKSTTFWSNGSNNETLWQGAGTD